MVLADDKRTVSVLQEIQAEVAVGEGRDRKDVRMVRKNPHGGGFGVAAKRRKKGVNCRTCHHVDVLIDSPIDKPLGQPCRDCFLKWHEGGIRCCFWEKNRRDKSNRPYRLGALPNLPKE